MIDGLCRGLEAVGHEVRLWATTDSTCPVPRSAVVSSAHTVSSGWPPVEIRHVIAGYAWLAEQGVDVVHDHTLIGPLTGPSRMAVPVATTNHLPFTSPELSVLYRDLCSKVAVVAVSRSQASAAGDTRIAAVIHHGTDVGTTPVGRGEGDEEGSYVAFLGRMSPDKGVHLAVRACRAAGLRLLIAARMEEPQEHKYFREEVVPLLGGTVRYLGELEHERKFHFLGRASALVNPVSWAEPFGLVMIEALACGTPVLALRGGAVPEIVDDGVTGAVCDGFNQLVHRLREIPRFDRRACRQAAERRFSIERMAEDHAALYRALIAAGRAST